MYFSYWQQIEGIYLYWLIAIASAEISESPQADIFKNTSIHFGIWNPIQSEGLEKRVCVEDNISSKVFILYFESTGLINYGIKRQTNSPYTQNMDLNRNIHQKLKLQHPPPLCSSSPHASCLRARAEPL